MKVLREESLICRESRTQYLKLGRSVRGEDRRWRCSSGVLGASNKSIDGSRRSQ